MYRLNVYLKAWNRRKLKGNLLWPNMSCYVSKQLHDSDPDAHT